MLSTGPDHAAIAVPFTPDSAWRSIRERGPSSVHTWWVDAAHAGPGVGQPRPERASGPNRRGKSGCL